MTDFWALNYLGLLGCARFVILHLTTEHDDVEDPTCIGPESKLAEDAN